MFDAEAPISLPCGCYHDIDCGIIHQCPVHLQEDEEGEDEVHHEIP